MLFYIEDGVLEIRLKLGIDDNGTSAPITTNPQQFWTVKMKHNRMKYVESGVRKLVVNDLFLLTGMFKLCFIKVTSAYKRQGHLIIQGVEVENKERILKVLQRQLKNTYFHPRWKSRESNKHLVMQEAPVTLLTDDLRDQYAGTGKITAVNPYLEDDDIIHEVSNLELFMSLRSKENKNVVL